MSAYFSYPTGATTHDAGLTFLASRPPRDWQRTEPSDEEIVVEEETEGIYRKLVVRDGRAIGGIVLGSEADAPSLVAAVREGRDVTPVLERLRAGDWGALAD